MQKQRESPEVKVAPKSSVHRWRAQEQMLLKQSQNSLRVKSYFFKDNEGSRIPFPEQERKLKEIILDLRGQGEPVTSPWVGNKMFILCCEDLPNGFDPSNKKQFGKKWVYCVYQMAFAEISDTETEESTFGSISSEESDSYEESSSSGS